MADLTQAIATHFDVQADQVVAYREGNNGISVLINYGIGGVKKFTLSPDDIKPAVAERTTRKRTSRKRKGS